MVSNLENINCWKFEKSSNDFWDFILPAGLSLSIRQKTNNGLIDLKESIVVRNQFRTYLASILETENISWELKHEIFESIINANLENWDENGISDWSQEYFLNFRESEFIEPVIFDAISKFLDAWWVLPDSDGFKIDEIMYNYSHFIIQSIDDPLITSSENQENIVIDTSHQETLTEFLDENWIPESSKEIIRWLFEKYGAFSEDTSEEDFWKIYHNLWVLVKFIVAVESSWGMNIRNSQWSSAKWPFQYLDWYINWVPTTVLVTDKDDNPILDENWNEIRRSKYNRETWDYSPFDTALRRNMEYYASQSPGYENDYYNYNKYLEYIPSWIINSYENQPELSPLDLSWEESINMWLVDSFCRWKTQEYMSGIILEWDAWDMKRFYNKIHHTAPDKRVSENVQRHFEIFANNLTPIDNFIFSQKPVSRPVDL